jgi:hypothetical protein
MSDAKLSLDSNPMPGVIRVVVPASVAGNFEKMQLVTKNVLTSLGHTGCHSGFRLLFTHEEVYRFNEKAEQIRF